jgi:DNA-binding transcriptional MerR regulator
MLEKFSIDDDRTWDGDAEALASKVAFWARHMGFSDISEITVRLIRDYAQRGIITKPHRVGKSAIYDWAHLVRLLAARKLLSDGWPLQKIAELFLISSIDEIRAMLPGPPPPATTQREDPALSDLRCMRQNSEPAKSSNILLPKQQAFSRMQKESTAQFSLRSVQKTLGVEPKDVKGQHMTRIEIAPGVELMIDRSRLRRMGQNEAGAIARAVEICLSNPKIRNDKDEDND